MTDQPSDTPETDFLDANRTSFTDFGLYCNALDHARDLERRLNAAIRERDAARAACLAAFRAWVQKAGSSGFVKDEAARLLERVIWEEQ